MRDTGSGCILKDFIEWYTFFQGAAKKARQSLANKWSEMNFSGSLIMSPETPVS